MAADETKPLGKCGSYELLVELAAGGMATVFLARVRDRRDAPLVAVKRPHRHLAKDKAYLTMLVDEARLASAIQHDNVVKVRELGFDSGDPFVVLDYIEGASLSEVRAELTKLGRAIDPRVSVRMVVDVLAGLQAAHVLHDDRGRHLKIVHRDISPHNVLVGCDGLSRVTDFGIAKAEDNVQTTEVNEVKGKLAYLAPERIDKRRICTPQSDVFSAAVVLWECIAGRRLFRAEEPLETLQEVIAAPIPSLRELGVPITEALDAVILKGLSRDLDVRYKTAAEFASALEQAGGNRAGVATHAEVSCLIEAVFGERLRIRHEKIRRALDDEEAEHTLSISGLTPRAAPTSEMRERDKRQLENVAPPAPSARYAFGASRKLPRSLASPRMRRALAMGAGVLAALLLIGVVSWRLGSSSQDRRAGASLQRHVVVPLPFRATHVTLDEQGRDLNPPADIVAFDVPRESGVRHRVTAVAAEGALAEAYVREDEGVARPEGEGYKVEALETYDEQTPASDPKSAPLDTSSKPRRARPAAAPLRTAASPVAPPVASASAKPVGSVKDGFTRLR